MAAGVTGEQAPETVPTALGPGPLLAVCSVCGGAGASTLSYLIGVDAASASERPVLACDAGSPTAGLSAYAGVESLHSLAELTQRIDEPRPEGVFAAAEAGLRLIAVAPRMDERIDAAAAERLLTDARRQHALTIVDCGVLGNELARLARQLATHVAWVLPATISGVNRGRRMLELIEPVLERRELVVARFDAGGRQPPMEDLTALAATRGGPLVLMPHVPDLGEQDASEALQNAQVTLEALRSLWRR